MRHFTRKNKKRRFTKLKKTLHNNNKKGICVTKFGKIIGRSAVVVAHSNCNNSFESGLNNFISYKNKNVFSGMQWQCVEYARRYLITKLGVTFSSVDGAEDVFALKTVESIQNGKKYKFKSYKNNLNCKIEDNMPKVHDVIIWARNKHDTPYGHIAVILKIEGDKLFIGEQNWSNDAWTSSPPHSYSRILTLKTNNNRCSIIDGNYKILGWKRVLQDMPISLIKNP
jgi:hypothetical protein